MRKIEYKKCSAVLVFNEAPRAYARGIFSASQADKTNQLALQLRASNDDSFPSHWDFSAGGGIDEGESDKDSAQRELLEELGVDAKIKFVTQEHFKYPAWDPSITREIDLFVYKTSHNGPFAIDRQEIEKVEFFDIEAIEKMISSNEKFHPEFILSWNKGIISKAAGH